MRPREESLIDDIKAYAPSVIALTILATVKLAVLALVVAVVIAII
jgi:hypothetical protein